MKPDSIPPMAKKTRTVTKYIIPIFLWSVVVIHPTNPSRCRGRPAYPVRSVVVLDISVSPRCSGGDTRRGFRGCAALLEAQQVGHQPVQLVLAQVQVGHPDAVDLVLHRLHRVRV